MQVEKVLINGELVAENGAMCVDIRKSNYPSFAKNIMNIGKILETSDFNIVSSDKIKAVS